MWRGARIVIRGREVVGVREPDSGAIGSQVVGEGFEGAGCLRFGLFDGIEMEGPVWKAAVAAEEEAREKGEGGGGGQELGGK